MDVIEQCSSAEHSASETMTDFAEEPPKIGGYDSGTISIHKEPSLYLSLLVVLIMSWMTLGANTILFWSSVLVFSLAAILLHLIAERIIFARRDSHEKIILPCEGLFVVCFGAVLPGIALVVYAAYTVFNSPGADVFGLLAKLTLLLATPLFNFIAWSAVKKHYLSRPRLIGLMNGLALGLSGSWTLILFKCLFVAGAMDGCRLGWMILLFLSPFLLSASLLLCLDLWRKTAPTISRIAGTFSILGVVLASLFVFAPVARAMVIEELIKRVRSASVSDSTKAISLLRAYADDDDLSPSANSVNGFGLARLLLPSRPLSSSQEDRNLFFKITGKTVSQNSCTKKLNANQGARSPRPDLVGEPVVGLSSGRSRLNVELNPSTMTGTVNWSVMLRNATTVDGLEAVGVVQLPAGGVVSNATLWFKGQLLQSQPMLASKDGTASGCPKLRKLMGVSVSAPEEAVLKVTVPPNGDEVRLQLKIDVPLSSTDGKTFRVNLPTLLASNFVAPKRHRLQIQVPCAFSCSSGGLVRGDSVRGYTLEHVLKNVSNSNAFTDINIANLALKKEICVTETPDLNRLMWPRKESVIQRLSTSSKFLPKKLAVVLDSSASMKDQFEAVRQSLEKMAANDAINAYLVPIEDDSTDEHGDNVAVPLDQLLKKLSATSFSGGQNNVSTLVQAIEATSEVQDAAVLWIHGPQPETAAVSYWADPVNRIRLYDFQITPGDNVAPESLGTQGLSSMIDYVPVSRHSAVTADLDQFFRDIHTPGVGLSASRTVCNASSAKPDASLSKSTCNQIWHLWAKEAVNNLIVKGDSSSAQHVALNHSIVTPISELVVLEARSADRRWPAVNSSAFAASAPVACLLNAPVDPRYGQSNEAGILADYGYDTARDISRCVTSLSFFVSICMGIWIVNTSRLSSSKVPWCKAAALAFGVPLGVHLLGTFLINNYGGLGGGL